MSKKAVRVFEYVAISLFLLVVVSLTSIVVYRAVIGSDWYQEIRIRDGFIAQKEKLQSENAIDYLGINGVNAPLRYFPADDPLLFFDLSCENYSLLASEEEIRDLFRETSITVFFKDGSQTHFYISDQNELYWGSLKVDCPSLLRWYSQYK